MADKALPHVLNPLSKPLLIWDGDCEFCRLWIERWRVVTAPHIDDEPYQTAATRFPEIPREQFERAVTYLECDGQVFFAAEAVYRSLLFSPSRRWLWWSYHHIPGFGSISEFGYKFIARHREFASLITRLFWGEDVRPPSYFWARKWFLRGLGLVYLIAFVSFWVQADGLIGSHGILPVRQFLAVAHQHLGARGWSSLPTLFWFNANDWVLHFLCGCGVALSMLLIAGIAPAISLLFLFALYLSLTIAGQIFLSFQWDILLLETGFLAIFVAPWQFRTWKLAPGAARLPAASNCRKPGQIAAATNTRQTPVIKGYLAPISSPALFLLKFLLFKLMLMSGVVKLTSGDDCWWKLTALDYHYWSQPLPTIFAWYADKGPEWFKHFSVAFCLAVEIVVPFFIWAPRRLRLIACALLISLQVAIAITGNYCFFNLLTIALCFLLIDDAVVGKARGAVRKGGPGGRALPDRLRICAAVAVILLTLPLNTWLIFDAFRPRSEMPGMIRLGYEWLEPFRIVNGYGLFRVMTKDRGEIIIEGSSDGIEWKSYEFKWKPGDVMRAPGWCAPHQPRLDWQMWFAALGSPEQNGWLAGLVVRLFENENRVTDLLKQNPFSNSPPRYIRAEFYRYRFTTWQEHQKSGAWWKRQLLGEYFREIPIERSGHVDNE
jgi:predicted DCC family thiol-disulfide oxidoreductase YuxK